MLLEFGIVCCNKTYDIGTLARNPHAFQPTKDCAAILDPNCVDGASVSYCPTTIAYPLPLVVYSTPGPDQFVTQSSQISGCTYPSQDVPLTTVTLDEGAMDIPTPLAWISPEPGTIAALLPPPFNTGNLSVLTVTNGVSLAAGSATATTVFSDTTSTYTVSITGHVVSEKFTSSSGFTVPTRTFSELYETSSTYDIESGIQQFIYHLIYNNVATPDALPGCLYTFVSTSSWAGSQSWRPLNITVVDPSQPPEWKFGNDRSQGPRVGGDSVSGAAADGVAKVLVRIPGLSQNQKINVSILDNPAPTDGEDGTLSPLIPNDTVSGGIVTLAAQNVSGEYVAFALYQAPLDFARPSVSGDDTVASRQIAILVKDDNNNVLSSTPLQIVRPPVLFVHGLWSDSGTWNQFKGTMVSALPGLATYSVDYSDSAASSINFSTPIVLQKALASLRDFKSQYQVAAAQFDVIAHSMGGLIANNMPIANQRCLSLQ